VADDRAIALEALPTASGLSRLRQTIPKTLRQIKPQATQQAHISNPEREIIPLRRHLAKVEGIIVYKLFLLAVKEGNG
jgi:hypothetical protein